MRLIARKPVGWLMVSALSVRVAEASSTFERSRRAIS
jgi:hypothetical protein